MGMVNPSKINQPFLILQSIAPMRMAIPGEIRMDRLGYGLCRNQRKPLSCNPRPRPRPPLILTIPRLPGTMQMVCMCLDVTCVLMVNSIGPEMCPTEQERQVLTDVWARYIHYKHWDEAVSPEVAVCLVTFMYLSPRIPFIAKKWQAKKEAKKNAHIDNRSTGNGQNDTSENHSAAS